MIFKCKNCSGNTVYSPELHALYCPYCSSENTGQRTCDAYQIQTCPDCGGELAIEEHTSALRCKYCLTQICWQKPTSRSWRTPEELYNEVKKDELYYITTNGGVTFGGGEPLLRAEFIREFRKLCGSLWKIRLETSLCANVDILSQLVSVVDEWIIDIKSMDDDVYFRYTGITSIPRNICLQYIVEHNLQDRCLIRIPLIPDYTTQADQQRDKKILEEMGFTRFDLFNYKIPKRHE